MASSDYRKEHMAILKRQAKKRYNQELDDLQHRLRGAMRLGPEEYNRVKEEVFFHKYSKSWKDYADPEYFMLRDAFVTAASMAPTAA